MQGHIVKRAKSSWTVVVELGRDPQTGKRRQLWRSVKGAKKEAQALLVRLLHQRDTGIDAPPGKLTVGEYLKRWLIEYARPNTAPKTFRRYEQIVRVHLLPTLTGIPLTKLRPLHIQQVYTQIREEGLSARTALYCHRVVREALQHAVKWQLLARNPADAVEPPRPDRHEIRIPNSEEAGRLLEVAAATPYGTLIYLAMMTGLRRGELLGLRWQDVDLEASVLHVRQTCQWLPREGFIFRQPKTYRSTRPVALSPNTVERLRHHRRREQEQRLRMGPAYKDNGLVFAGGLGAPIHQSSLRNAWLQIVDKADLGHLRFHDLRHAHASLLLKRGVHPKIVSERLGHSGISITMDTYSHVMPGLQVEAVAQLDGLVKGGRI